jgi:hypothetical protein
MAISGGTTTTIGIREAEDVKLAYDYVFQKGEKNIFLYGSSMGAVAVARSIAKYNLQLSGVFLDMPFASMQSHVRARLRAIGFEQFIEKPFSFFCHFLDGSRKWHRNIQTPYCRLCFKIQMSRTDAMGRHG